MMKINLVNCWSELHLTAQTFICLNIYRARCERLSRKKQKNQGHHFPFFSCVRPHEGCGCQFCPLLMLFFCVLGKWRCEISWGSTFDWGRIYHFLLGIIPAKWGCTRWMMWLWCSWCIWRIICTVWEILWVIHSKSEKVCRTAFSVKKNCAKVLKSGRNFWAIWG